MFYNKPITSPFDGVAADISFSGEREGERERESGSSLLGCLKANQLQFWLLTYLLTLALSFLGVPLLFVYNDNGLSFLQLKGFGAGERGGS